MPLELDKTNELENAKTDFNIEFYINDGIIDKMKIKTG